MNCPTCGAPVRVHSSNEGTNSYERLELDQNETRWREHLKETQYRNMTETEFMRELEYNATTPLERHCLELLKEKGVGL